MKTKKNPKIITKDSSGKVNGYLVPIYNINDKFHITQKEPQQVYLTVVQKNASKGPHLHKIRSGFFTCIRGNVKFIIKENNNYMEYYSGEEYDYLSIIVEINTPVLIQNIGNDEAYILNMPSPAWTPEMNDEYADDFSDYLLSRAK